MKILDEKKEKKLNSNFFNFLVFLYFYFLSYVKPTYQSYYNKVLIKPLLFVYTLLVLLTCRIKFIQLLI